MVTLFSQEKVSEIHDYNIAKDARDEGVAEGRIEGRAEGRSEERLLNLKLMMKNLGLSASQALDALCVADEERPALLELLL